MDFTNKKLILIAGPTAVGKTSLAIELARKFETEIISTDSRQFYSEMQIGTAAPTAEELSLAKHHFIGNLSINNYYNVSIFEKEAINLINKLFETKDIIIAVGGSGLYIDALCYGIDDLPDADEKLRADIKSKYKEYGIEYLQNEVKRLDPDYFEIADIKNPKRLQRALEVIYETGKTYSSQRTNKQKQREFQISKYVLNMDREELYQRINLRVDLMMEAGLEKEAKSLYPYKDLNALNTVGYKELFSYFDGKISLDQAVTDIKTHSRRYAKRQITWFKRDNSYKWIKGIDEIVEL
jgi:tRNA dimethylallyltransferase